MRWRSSSESAPFFTDVPRPSERGREALGRLMAHDTEHWLPIICKLDLPRD